MQRIFITGAGRGIGLEVTRQYLQRGDRVVAGARSIERAPALRQLQEQHRDLLTVVPVEVTDVASITAAVTQIHEHVEALDVLINNAAINSNDVFIDGPDGQQLLDASRPLEVLRVNAVAPIVVAQACMALLRAGVNPRVVNISSGAGSLAQKSQGGDYSYAVSKTALNMFTRTFAFNAKADGITAIMIDPGWVKTDMGGPNARLEPAESASGLLKVIDGLTPQDAGRFLRYDGSEVAW